MSATATTPQRPGTFIGEIVRRAVRFVGPVAGPLAGRRFFPLWAVIRHTGRVSGRAFATPIVVVRTPTGFIVPLPFANAHWPRNVLAAGGATIHWKGRDWSTSEPLIVGPEGASAFNAVERVGIRAFGMSRFLRLTAVEVPRAR